MKVVACEVNQGVQIGDHVQVTVLDVQEDHIRLGIASEKDIPPYREEVIYLTEQSAGELLPSQ